MSGLSVMVMGLGMVFLVLAILACAILIFNWIFKQFESKEKDKAVSGKLTGLTGAGKAEKLPPGVLGQPVQQGSALPPEKLAAIVAAVSASLRRPVDEVQLVTVRKVEGSYPWAASGRGEAIALRRAFSERSRR